MRLPDYLIIGAQKAGTTWLVDVLRQHPDIYLPREEIHFFDKKENYNRGITWYARHFEGADAGQIIGEKTPDYLCQLPSEATNNNIHLLIKEALPNIKLIVLLRNPADRAISAINHMYRTQRLNPLLPINYVLESKYKEKLKSFGVFEYGKYSKYLEKYIAAFGRKNIHIAYYEDLFNDMDSQLDSIFKFLNLSYKKEQIDSSFQSNSYSRSRLGLTIEYYFPVLQRVARKLDGLLPNDKARPSEENMKKIRQIYISEIEKLGGIMTRIPEKWKR